MYTIRDFGLSSAMFPNESFEAIAKIAGKAGFSNISLNPRLFQQAIKKKLTVDDLKSILLENNLTISELDPYCAWVGKNIPSNHFLSSFFSISEDEFFEVAEALGARNLNTIYALDEKVDLADIADKLRILSQKSSEKDLIITFEFVPWMQIGNLDFAIQLAKEVNHHNFGINLDFWHHTRTGGSVQEIDLIPKDLLKGAQISDVQKLPWENIIMETSQGRELPGLGFGNVAQKLIQLKKREHSFPIIVEVFNRKLFELPPEEFALQCSRSIIDLIKIINEIDKNI